jgi:hypothetical protein
MGQKMVVGTWKLDVLSKINISNKTLTRDRGKKRNWHERQ